LSLTMCHATLAGAEGAKILHTIREKIN